MRHLWQNVLLYYYYGLAKDKIISYFSHPQNFTMARHPMQIKGLRYPANIFRILRDYGRDKVIGNGRILGIRPPMPPMTGANTFLFTGHYLCGSPFMRGIGNKNRMLSGSVSPKLYLFERPKQIPNFKLQTSVVTCFIQHLDRVLVLKRSSKEDHASLWGTPGGQIEQAKDLNAEAAIIREVFEETGIKLDSHELKLIGKRYARVPGWDYILYIYYAELKDRPAIQLSEEHTEAKWVKLENFKSLELLTSQHEAFDIVFRNHSVWQRELNSEALIFKKNNQSLCFSAERRLIINLFGITGSGKGTQGEMISKIYGIPHISVGDLVREEYREKTIISQLITSYNTLCPNTYVPDEICIGILSKRLAMRDCQQGYVLDGFPRTPKQAPVLLDVMMRHMDTYIPVYMKVEEIFAQKRVKNRFICPKCGYQCPDQDMNVPGCCPKPSCMNEKMMQRSEDIDENELSTKFYLFNKNINDVIKILETRTAVHRLVLNGQESPQEVLPMINQILQARLDESYSSNMKEKIVVKY